MGSTSGRRVAIARVEGGGTAFAIARDLALTALHVVAEQPTITFSDESWPVATVERSDEALDVAVLRLAEPGLPDELAPLPLATAVRSGQPWRGHGYPEATGGQYTIGGLVMDPDARLEGGAPAIQLHCLQESAVSPLPLGGMSGSPVLDRESGTVIGIIRRGFFDAAAARAGTVGGDIFATLAADVARLWPDLLSPLLRRQRRRLRADLAALLLHDLTPADELPQVWDMTAHQVGARRTRYSETGSAPYVHRPAVDAGLADLLRREHVIVVAGPSSAGKSRTAFEALHATMGDAGFAHPLPAGRAISKLIQADREEPLCAGPLVVWLDELDAYLHDDSGLSPAVVEWLEGRPRGGVIVATIREEKYNDHRGDAGTAGMAVRLFLERAERGAFLLRHKITRDEAREATRLYPGEDFSDLGVGIGNRLVGGPEQVRRLQEAETGNPAGWAVIKAAVDCRWMGLPAPVPDAVLRRLFGVAMRDRFPHLPATDEAYQQGLSWASQRGESGVALVDVLDHAEEHGLRRRWTVAGNSWQVAISAASTADLLSVAAAAREHDLPEVAISALQKAAADGSSIAAIELGVLLAESGNLEAGKEWIARAVEAHEIDALSAMGAVLAGAGDLDAATGWFWRGIEAGDPLSALLMGRVQRDRGQYEASMYWLRIAAEEGAQAAWLLLAELLGESGDNQAAAECLERGACGDGVHAACCRWQLAWNRDDHEDAERWLRTAAELGDVESSRMLGQLLGHRGETSQAEYWLRRIVDQSPGAAYDLGALFERVGNPAAAEEWYRRGYDRGAGQSAVALSRLRLAAGDVEQAAAWLRAGADSPGTEPGDVYPVAIELAERLRREGSESDAVAWLDEGAAAGWVPAMARRGDWAAADRDWDTAERWYLKAANARYPGAAAGLGEVLESRGERHRAALWLQVALQRGSTPDDRIPAVTAALSRVSRSLGDRDEDAAKRAYQHASRLRDAGDDSGAVRWLRRAAADGHIQAAAELASLTDDPLERPFWVIKACAAGHPEMLRNVAELKLSAGHADEAEELYRRAAENGDLIAANALGGLLSQRGETSEARDWYTRAADGGIEHAMHNLGVLTRDLGHQDEARTWFRRAADGGFVPAMEVMATMLGEEGDSQQEESWLAKAFEHGSGHAAFRLAYLCQQRGDREGALTWARAAAGLKHPTAALMAGTLTYHDGDLAEAEKWFRVAVLGDPTGDRSGDTTEDSVRELTAAAAVARLAALVARRGDSREAELLLAGPVRQAEPFALQSVADLAVRRGWMRAAEWFYGAAAQRGHPFAALDAAALAEMRGARERKASWLRAWRSTETLSAMAFRYETDYGKVRLIVFHPARWEPGQARSYELSTPVITRLVNTRNVLDQDEFGR
jgi:tetratricopeptide (TPR) repeat protein